MNTLHGKKAEDFVIWLEKARHLLPDETTIEEAKELFLKKNAEEFLKNEKQN